MKLTARIAERHSLAEKQYFNWIAQLPCVISGNVPVQVAHIRGADAWFAKELPGMKRKPSIPYVVPLAHDLHIEQEAANWPFWARHGYPREPAQESILFTCWWLWGLYKSSHRVASLGTTSQRVASLYLAALIRDRE